MNAYIYQAALWCEDCIAKNGLGARDAGHCQIWNKSKVVAHVAYNGNVWQGIWPYGKDDLLLNVTGLVWYEDKKAWDLSKETIEACSIRNIRAKEKAVVCVS